MNVNTQPAKGLAIPFDHHRLDRLMDEWPDGNLAKYRERFPNGR